VSDEDVFKELSFKNMKGRSQEQFPVKLHKILDHCDLDGYSFIISWLPHGRAFKIHDMPLFIEQVMPKYFYQSKMSSFRRQLNFYGFYKLRNGVDKSAFCHELFLHDRLGLSAAIMRQTSSKRQVEFENKPKFYKMLPLCSSVFSFSNAPKVIDANKPRTFISTYKEKIG